jgi:hypothetical protein
MPRVHESGLSFMARANAPIAGKCVLHHLCFPGKGRAAFEAICNVTLASAEGQQLCSTASGLLLVQFAHIYTGFLLRSCPILKHIHWLITETALIFRHSAMAQHSSLVSLTLGSLPIVALGGGKKTNFSTHSKHPKTQDLLGKGG